MQKNTIPRPLLSLSAIMLALLPLLGAVQVRAADDTSWPRGTTAPNARQMVTIEAVVIDRGDADRFEVRANGETFNVLTTDGVRVREGDRVVLRGSFNRDDDFDPRSVRVLRTNEDWDGGTGQPIDDRVNDKTPYFDDRVSFPATVLRIVSRQIVQVRGGNGRTYRVDALKGTDGVRVGDQVRIEGRADGLQVREGRFLDPNDEPFIPFPTDDRPIDDGYDVDQLPPISVPPFPSDNRPDDGYDVDQLPPMSQALAVNVDFPGSIIRLNKVANLATVRGDNGREYQVRGEDVDRFVLGNRVRVRGVVRTDVIELSHLDRLR